MSFVVEDGTGLETATSYVDVAFADAYFLTVGFTAWAGFDAAKKQNLLEQATEFTDMRWGDRMRGTLLKLTQALQFPRSKLFDRYGRVVNGVPVPFKRGVCEYAMQASKGPLVPDTAPAKAELKKTKVVVGPVTTEKEFNTAVSVVTIPKYPKADMYFKPFVNSVSSGGKVIR